MVAVLPASLHRLGFRLAHALRKRWWRLCKPQLRGCRVLAFDPAGRVLLIRHSYGSGKWMPPGGGVERGEDALAAAIRELREETRCEIDEAREIAVLTERLHGAANTVHLVAGRARGTPAVDGREVIEAAFFALDGLPDPMPGWIRQELAAWVTAAKAARPAPPDRARAPAPPPAPTG